MGQELQQMVKTLGCGHLKIKGLSKFYLIVFVDLGWHTKLQQVPTTTKKYFFKFPEPKIMQSWSARVSFGEGSFLVFIDIYTFLD